MGFYSLQTGMSEKKFQKLARLKEITDDHMLTTLLSSSTLRQKAFLTRVSSKLSILFVKRNVAQNATPLSSNIAVSSHYKNSRKEEFTQWINFWTYPVILSKAFPGNVFGLICNLLIVVLLSIQFRAIYSWPCWKTSFIKVNHHVLHSCKLYSIN